MFYEILRLHHIGRRSDGQVINDISFNLLCQEALCILTEDIETKNFLFSLFRGETKPDQGKLLLHDKPCLFHQLEDVHAAGIYIADEHLLVPGMSVAHNLFMTDDTFYENHQFLNNSRMDDAARKLLKHYRLSHIPPHRRICELPFFDRYLLSILHTLTLGAKIVILDTSIYLPATPQETKLLQHVVSALKEQGLSLLWFSNKWNPIFQNFDRYGVIQDGVVTQLAPLSSIPPYIPEPNFMEYELRRHSINGQTGKKLVFFQNGSFDFTLYEGEILGLCDPLQRSADFFHEISHGNPHMPSIIDYNGKIYRGSLPPPGKTAYIMPSARESRIFPQMTLYDNVTLLLKTPMYNCLGHVNRRIRNHMTQAALKSIGASDIFLKYRKKKDLAGSSTQEQFLIEIAKWVCLKPKLFVFCNSASVYNSLSAQRFSQFLERLRPLGITILLISSSEENLQKFCTRIIELW
jgi:ABC-type sugar transport system ATPase subunit